MAAELPLPEPRPNAGVILISSSGFAVEHVKHGPAGYAITKLRKGAATFESPQALLRAAVHAAREVSPTATPYYQGTLPLPLEDDNNRFSVVLRSLHLRVTVEANEWAKLELWHERKPDQIFTMDSNDFAHLCGHAPHPANWAFVESCIRM